MGFFEKLGQGLAKTRNAIFGSIGEMENADRIDDDTYEELTEQLVLADTGLDVAESLVAELKARVRRDHLKTGAEALNALKSLLVERLTADRPFVLEGKPAVLLVIGVNGVGKTTSIGKLGQKLTAQGKKVLFAAADTFRAAAADQLSIWADRCGADLVRHSEGADPAAVIFDACTAAKARHADVMICDTAGRLHNKQNLMNELSKMRRVIDRELPGADVETLLVLDATTGQNALTQAEAFNAAAPLTGVILTKLDGTAKGGIAIHVSAQTKVPVKFVGVGETADDLLEFDPKEFTRAFFA